MFALNQGLSVQIKQFWDLIWPLRDLTQIGEGTGSPWPQH
jgi:hypothetical protein